MWTKARSDGRFNWSNDKKNKQANLTAVTGATLMKRGLEALRKCCRENQEPKRSDPRAVLSYNSGKSLFKYEEGNVPCLTTDSL